MKYNIILLFFLTSCVNNILINKNNFTYSAKGFAAIESKTVENLYNKKFFVSHTKLKIINPDNNIFIETIVKKKLNMMIFTKF